MKFILPLMKNFIWWRNKYILLWIILNLLNSNYGWLWLFSFFHFWKDKFLYIIQKKKWTYNSFRLLNYKHFVYLLESIGLNFLYLEAGYCFQYMSLIIFLTEKIIATSTSFAFHQFNIYRRCNRILSHCIW